MKNEVGVGEEVAGFDRDQCRIARPRPDHRDTPGMARARPRQSRSPSLGLRFVAGAQQLAHIGSEQPAIGTRLFGQRNVAFAQSPAHPTDERCERSPLPDRASARV